MKLVAVGNDNATLLRDVRRLFKEYQSLIDADICFVGFTEELDGLPGAYAAPSGSLLLAILTSRRSALSPSDGSTNRVAK